MKSCKNCIYIGMEQCNTCRLNLDPNAATRNLLVDRWKLNPAYYQFDLDVQPIPEPPQPLTEVEVWELIESGYEYCRQKRHKLTKKQKRRNNKLYEQIKDIAMTQP